MTKTKLLQIKATDIEGKTPSVIELVVKTRINKKVTLREAKFSDFSGLVSKTAFITNVTDKEGMFLIFHNNCYFQDSKKE